MYAAGKSAALLGVMMAITYGTMIYLSPVIGALLDRYSRKMGIIFADSVVAISSVGLAVAVSHDADIPVVLTLVFVHSCGMSAQQLSLQASVRELRTEENLTSAAALVALIDNIPLFLGPIVGATVYTLASPAALFAVEAIVATVAVVTVAFLPFPARQHRKISGGVTVGFRFILAERDLRQVQGSFAVLNLANGLALPALLAVVISAESTWPESFRLSVYNIANAGGLVVGAALVLWVGRWLPRSVIVLAGIVGGAVFGRMVLPLVLGVFALVISASFVRNVSAQWANTPLTALWQERTPRDIQASVFGARRFLGQGVYPLALLVGGWWADYGSLGVLFMACAVVELAVAGFLWRSRVLV
ncbi:Major Facilitator Superfamily transporter [Corynebacterium mustelae]|uniref:Major Facilitator Superfamily transporter n=1 Tax=Corynebacterium mustelae TaxID=571915 RepID=A0A0G3GX29_9CORY|nr:MFS transporter [Corynebacterium mustelae]AKK05689.1 Major Facilitator Superfamily transporter [Corynebacterium mustelae]